MIFMKKILTLLFFSTIVLIISLRGIGQNLSTTIKVQAMDMAKALMRNDFATFSKYMHPGIIEFAGGKEKMKNKMDSADAAMKQFGISFKRYWIGSPGKVINYMNQLQSVLPQTTIMKTPLGELIAETYLVAISIDKGKNWFFIDTNMYKADKLKTILPDISPKLTIPPQKKPQLVPTENKE